MSHLQNALLIFLRIEKDFYVRKVKTLIETSYFVGPSFVIMASFSVTF